MTNLKYARDLFPEAIDKLPAHMQDDNVVSIRVVECSRNKSFWLVTHPDGHFFRSDPPTGGWVEIPASEMEPCPVQGPHEIGCECCGSRLVHPEVFAQFHLEQAAVRIGRTLEERESLHKEMKSLAPSIRHWIAKVIVQHPETLALLDKPEMPVAEAPPTASSPDP